jgi:hypothetical protein
MYITAIWYILRPFGNLVAIWYISLVLVKCVKKNLAALVLMASMLCFSQINLQLVNAAIMLQEASHKVDGFSQVRQSRIKTL